LFSEEKKEQKYLIVLKTAIPIALPKRDFHMYHDFIFYSPIIKLFYVLVFYSLLFVTETKFSELSEDHWLVQCSTTKYPAFIPLFGVVQTILTQAGYYMDQVKRQGKKSVVSYLFAEQTIYLGVYYGICIQWIQLLGCHKTAWTLAVYSSLCLENHSRLFLELYPSTLCVHIQILGSHAVHIFTVCLLSFYNYSVFYDKKNSNQWLQNMQYNDFMRHQMESYIVSDIIFYLHLKGWKNIYPFEKIKNNY
jgi:hypothetical protein